MGKLIGILCLFLTVLFGSVGISAGADLQKGWTAYQSGNFATALREWRPLAEKGNADAQYLVGGMYATGQGVIRDWVFAHMWGNLAASNGNENGGKLREIAAKNMTPANISTAQRLARECVRKKYKGC